MKAVHSRLKEAEKIVGNGGLLFGEAVALGICLGEIVFFCAYVAALPFLIVWTLVGIPHWLRRHVRFS